ncbi:hypothetical protein B0H13DRAFT_2369216 [Mycena leptocephala]|nr:hypothetical protein B0H13DRAFT_2369216 [Mycena leptocephala]
MTLSLIYPSINGDLWYCSQRTATRSGCRGRRWGIILIDEVGKPTGVLLDNSQELLKMPALTEAEVMERFMTAVNDALASGLTCVHDVVCTASLLCCKWLTGFHSFSTHIPIRIYGMKFFDETEPYWGNITKPIVGAADGRLTAPASKSSLMVPCVPGALHEVLASEMVPFIRM